MGYVLRTKARYRNDNTGRLLLLPALLTEQGILISLLRFMAAYQRRSQQWRERLTFAVTLLIHFIHANQDAVQNPVKLLEAFSAALFEGTVNPLDHTDPSGLFWSPRRWDDASYLLNLINQYTDWLAKQEGNGGKPINHFRAASGYEERMNWCAYYNKKKRVFLNHLEEPADIVERMRKFRVVSGREQHKYDLEEAKRFPEEHIENLLDKGFVQRRRVHDKGVRDIDYKSKLIAFLLHWGGVRKSEALSLYLEDIYYDKKTKESIVRIYHPVSGRSPDKRYVTRKEYLAERFMLKPRTEYLISQRLHLGWKTPMLNDRDNYFKVQFYPPDKAVEFTYLFKQYLKCQRVKPQASADHPYLFTNSEGHPETLKNFQRLHKAAVNRVGLDHAKNLGTTEHGHRHAYGYRLAEMGFTEIDIQKAMHHKSSDSCRVYTQRSDKDLRKRMGDVDGYG